MKEIKFKKRQMKDEVAVVVAAFGSTKSGKLAYDKFNEQLVSKNLINRIEWAYTSEIIRERTGTPGVLEALAKLEAEGFRKIVVQPLHVFPATEYSVLESMCRNFPNIRIVMGETLMHRWKFVDQVVDVISREFITEAEGLNIVIGHGTPLCADPANSIYINIEHSFASLFSNVLFATLDGVPNISMLKRKIPLWMNRQPLLKESIKRKVRIIPLMIVAGMHVNKDLLADEGSLAADLKELGFIVDFPVAEYQELQIPKALGFYEEVNEFFINRIERSLELMKYY